MVRKRRKKIPLARRTVYSVLAVLLCVCLISCAKTARTKNDSENYKILHKVVLQPVDHANPDGRRLEQHVDILIPNGTPNNAPVFFNLGNESDLTDNDLVKFYRLHGNDHRIIYVQAEHRGYGQSLTSDENQSIPSYVQINQVLADAHETIQQLKRDYPGPWMAAGWSYGGGLVINFAVEYPDDVKVILSSSGVVDWPFLNYSYDRQVRRALGESCYRRLVKHSKNLKPKKLFDKNWLDREFLYATAMGVTQYQDINKLKSYFRLLSFLPTSVFLKVLHWMDDIFGKGKAWSYARGQGAKKITHEEVALGVHNWHTFRYQQCTQVGVFQASEEPDGLFTRTRDDFCAECRALFGNVPSYAVGPEWSPRQMLGALRVPMVYVSGGNDPWLAICLEPDSKIENGKYFYVKGGFHCPDRDDPQLARQVLAEMLKYALPKSPSK
jgi:pimeloyl-ACP methyl ester carboxylesterase